MVDLFSIEGYFGNDEANIGQIKLTNIKLYVNLPEWIKERNVYDLNKRQIGTLKPAQFNGLTYFIYDIIIDDIETYAEIETRDFGKCLVKVTMATLISNEPVYERGNF